MASPKRPTAITSLRETSPQGKKNWLIYAPSGYGKTVLAGTAPRALFLTVEAAGTESAAARGSAADEWVIEEWADLQEAFLWLKQEGHRQYDWVIVDSLSEMEELCWKDQLEAVGKEFEARIQDYGIVDRRVKKLVDQFNRLPINVLYTAQQMGLEVEDDDGDSITKVLPLVGRVKGGAPLSNRICGMVTLIGLLTVKQDDDKNEFRRLWVHGGERWIAKDRHDTFSRYIDEPNIAEMVEAVDVRRAAGNEPAAKKTATPKKGKRATESSKEDED